MLFNQPAFQVSWAHFFVNLTMLQNGFDVPLVDGVYWTLWIELKFYALVLIMVWLAIGDWYSAVDVGGGLAYPPLGREAFAACFKTRPAAGSYCIS